MLRSLTIPLKIAILSFEIGTLLLISNYLITNQFHILITGLFFVLIAIIIIFITPLTSFVKCIFRQKRIQKQPKKFLQFL